MKAFFLLTIERNCDVILIVSTIKLRIFRFTSPKMASCFCCGAYFPIVPQLLKLEFKSKGNGCKFYWIPWVFNIISWLAMEGAPWFWNNNHDQRHVLWIYWRLRMLLKTRIFKGMASFLIFIVSMIFLCRPLILLWKAFLFFCWYLSIVSTWHCFTWASPWMLFPQILCIFSFEPHVFN